MTNTIAIWFGGIIIAFFLLDAFVLGLDTHVLLMRGMLDLIEFVAFWR